MSNSIYGAVLYKWVRKGLSDNATLEKILEELSYMDFFFFFSEKSITSIRNKNVGQEKWTLEMYRSSVTKIQMRDDGDLNKGTGIGGGMSWLGLGYILRIKPTIYTGP